jgi:hypothetical protein
MDFLIFSLIPASYIKIKGWLKNITVHGIINQWIEIINRGGKINGGKGKSVR